MKFSTKEQSIASPNVASLFSGAGGLDLGFIRAGGRIIWAVDNDQDCCETYRKNIGDHVIHADVSDLDFTQMPKADIVIGGFPCQGFSRANRLRSKEDDRNALYRHLLRCITNTRPKIFLAENVRGILSLDGGKIVTEIVDDFRQAGYRTNYYVANAYEYGVPQSRWRVFFVGIRDDLEGLFCPPQPTHSDPEKISDDSILKPWITVENALKDIPEPNTETELLNHIGSAYKVSDRDFTGHRRTIPNRPSPTILARGNGKGGVCALNHPKNHRRITVRESAILQSFPMNFEFVGGLMSMYRQVGNAVPVLLAEAFARSVIELERSL